MTTATASISEEVEDLCSHRTLQVARATRDALAASFRYRRLRLREIKLMRTIAIDDYEEAEALLKAADRQVREIKHILNSEGRGLFNAMVTAETLTILDRNALEAKILLPWPPQMLEFFMALHLKLVVTPKFMFMVASHGVNRYGAHTPDGPANNHIAGMPGFTPIQFNLYLSSLILPAITHIPLQGPSGPGKIQHGDYYHIDLDPTSYDTGASSNTNIGSGEQDFFYQGTYNALGTSFMPSSHDAHNYGIDLSSVDPPPAPLQNTGEYSQQAQPPFAVLLPPPPPNPANPTDRLRAATAMIQVTGQEGDVLATHQNHHGLSRAPSQDRLRTFTDSSIYSLSSRRVSSFGMLSRPPSSRFTSVYSASQQSVCDVDGADGAPKRCAPRGTHKKNIDAVCLAWYPEDVQEVLNQKARMAWKTTVCESLMHANAACNTNVEMTRDIETTFFIGENSEVSVDPAEHTSWKIGQLMKLKDQTNPSTFFMHEHDDKVNIPSMKSCITYKVFRDRSSDASPVKLFAGNYKTTPTHMYTLSAVAFTCALDHVATGRTHNSRHAISFTGMEYGPIYDTYYRGLLQGLQHDTIGPAFTN
ncbi:hypothetical protein BKA83DRAFT_18466 [Pisolithus microcarpus]|nr:hypothetical protein BKA83DRAFT_18466 [Pisolithus microcarpus]